MIYFIYVTGCGESPGIQKGKLNLNDKTIFFFKTKTKAKQIHIKKALEVNNLAPNICIFFTFFEFSPPNIYMK